MDDMGTFRKALPSGVFFFDQCEEEGIFSGEPVYFTRFLCSGKAYRVGMPYQGRPFWVIGTGAAATVYRPPTFTDWAFSNRGWLTGASMLAWLSYTLLAAALLMLGFCG